MSLQETFNLFKRHVTPLFVSLSKKNVQTADPIGPKVRVGPHMNPERVYGCLKLQKFVSKGFLIFVKV